MEGDKSEQRVARVNYNAWNGKERKGVQAEKPCSFCRARKRMSDVIGATAAFIFFLIPPIPAANGFSSIDRSIDRSTPRDRLSNRDRSAVPFPLCRLFAGKKESAQHRPTPARNRVNKCWGLLGMRVYGYVYA